MAQQDCSLLVAIARWPVDTFDGCSRSYLILVHSQSLTLFWYVYATCVRERSVHCHDCKEVKTQTSSTTLKRSCFANCSRLTVLRQLKFILIKLLWSWMKFNGTFFLCGGRSENCLDKANISNTHTHTHTRTNIYMLLYSHTMLRTTRARARAHTHTHTHTHTYIYIYI